VVETWYGMFAPAGTAPAVVAQINADVNALLQQADIRDALARQGLTVVGGGAERFGDLVRRELARWARVVAAARIKAD
jgi:tripartite-type tricarboxylate transporter receptor subunit TctC